MIDSPWPQVCYCSQGEHHSTIEAGRDPRRAVVQFPAPSRVKTEFKPGCSGLCPVESLKPPRTEISQPPWQPGSVLESG